MRMQPDELAQLKADVDYSQIPPIQQKRIIAFINHFVGNTVSYLNNFCESCESRFMEFEYKLQKVEASLLILEAQLSSIPDFNKQALLIPNPSENTDPSKNEKTDTTETAGATVTVSTSSNGKIDEIESLDNNFPVGTKAIDHPKFTKYFKMLKVGVKEEGVKQKMQGEGVDPSILDNPEAIIID